MLENDIIKPKLIIQLKGNDMGASYQSMTYKASSVESLKGHFKEIQNNACYNHGHDSYSGHIGMSSGLQVSSSSFKTHTEAEDYVMEKASKWGPAIAVKVGDFSKVFPTTANEAKEVEKLKELKLKVENWDKSLIDRVKQSKSMHRGCKVCGSKVAVKYLRTKDCPICLDHNFVETETDKKAYNVLQEKYKEQIKKVKEMENKYAEKNKGNFWYIGAWCAS